MPKCRHCNDDGYTWFHYDEERPDARYPCKECRRLCETCRKYVPKELPHTCKPLTPEEYALYVDYDSREAFMRPKDYCPSCKVAVVYRYNGETYEIKRRRAVRHICPGPYRSSNAQPK